MKEFLKEYNTLPNWAAVFGALLVITLSIGIIGLTKEVIKNTNPIDTALMERLYATCLDKSHATSADCADQARGMATLPSLNKPQPPQ